MSVADFECEEVFFNQPLIVRHDPKHSRHEARFYALGRTDSKRRLLVAFTVRRKLIRVISAREMTRSQEPRLLESRSMVLGALPEAVSQEATLDVNLRQGDRINSLLRWDHESFQFAG